LENGDSGQVRLDKIIRMIGECELGIHDLSRVDTHGRLPRFNMPLELGLFLGAQKFGGKRNRRKACLVLEGERYQYQRFISDLAGVDPAAHLNQPEEAVGAVRKFLSGHRSGQGVPGRDRADLIIMDEPTSSLSYHEAERLREAVRELKQQSKTIVFVSHRLEEVFGLAERVTVLRDGRKVSTESVSQLTRGRLVSLIGWTRVA
jgi:hypothetical protein